MDATKTKTVKMIQDNPVMVFAKSWCPYCQKAEARLKNLGAKFEYYKMDQEEPNDGAAIQDILNDAEVFGVNGAVKDDGLTPTKQQRSVPNIWIGQKQIGGWDNFSRVSDKDVIERLEAAGAL